MTTGSHAQGVRLIPETFQRESGRPKETIARVPGHSEDWLRAIKDPAAPRPSGNFDYSSHLTEVVLLGTLALKVGVGVKLEYDFKTGQFTNNADANQFLRREPRAGWEFGYKA